MSAIAVAVGIGGALIGASASSSAANKASDSNQASIDAQSKATGDRLAFDKQVYADGSSDRNFASEMGRTTAANQAADRTKYNTLQDEQIARGKVFQGAEDKMLTDAQTWDSPERQAQAAAKAEADVNQGFASAQGQQQRNMARMGINPSSGRALAVANQGSIAQAGSLASAANNARTLVQTQGYARKMDAVGLGKGVIGNQATQAGLQLAAGNSAVNNSIVPIQVSNAANSAMSTGYGNAASAYGVLGANQANQFYNTQGYGNGVGQNVASAFGTMYKTPGVANGISQFFANNFGTQAGSMNGNGSVQGNPNYIYDL